MVISPKKILWPTDFSELSLQGGRYARGFRDVFGAELHLLHVIPPPISPDVPVMLPAEVPVPMGDTEMIAACRTGLQRLIKDYFDDDKAIVFDAFFGSPWSGVCDYAQRAGIDLIIVTTHGRTGIKHALIGSTAERIVRHAPCPVLVVKSPEKDFLIE